MGAVTIQITDGLIDGALGRAASAASACRKELLKVDPDSAALADPILAGIGELRAAVPSLGPPRDLSQFALRMRLLRLGNRWAEAYEALRVRAVRIRKAARELPGVHRAAILALAEELGELLADRMFDRLVADESESLS
jgi:hypothetical protein